MVDITQVGQTVQNGDRATAAWLNSVHQKFAYLEQQLALANEQISNIKSQLSQAFRVAPVSGLTVSYGAGSVKLSSGLVATTNGGLINVTDNTRSYLFVDNADGLVKASINRAQNGYEFAYVVAAGGKVTQVVNYPIFETKTAPPDLGNYATLDYANSRSWEDLATARKTTQYAIPQTDTYYTIPFENLKGAGFNTAGLFTAPVGSGSRRYVFQAQIRVDTDAPFTQPDLAVKISLFANNSETCILQQMESARGDITLNAANAEPVTLQGGQTATIRVYLTAGYRARVREQSLVQVWRLPLPA